MIPLARQLIAFSWLGFWIYWAVTAVSAKPTKETQSKNWSWRFAALSFGIFLLIKYVPGVREVAGLRLWPEDPRVGDGAAALAVAGLAVLIWARVSIGRDWSGEVVLKEDHQLATKGPYAAIRHPIYTGLLMLMLATAVDYGVLGGFAYFAAFAGVFFYKSRVEEAFMTAHFPEAYPAYRKKTKAFIPSLF